jgi:hypothetical protein
MPALDQTGAGFLLVPAIPSSRKKGPENTHKVLNRSSNSHQIPKKCNKLMKRTISTLLATCTVLGCAMLAPTIQAQNYYYDANTYGYNSGSLGQTVFTLDQYGDQMSYLYSIEARGYCGCSNAAALLSEMRRYNAHTNNLMAAYRGTCPTSFKKAACCVRDSLTRIEALRSRARVSPQVCALISQSCPLASYVHTNYAMFRPVPAPVPYHVYHRAPTCTPAPDHHHGHHTTRHGKIDVGSAIFGAVAGRVLHGVIHGH